MKCSGSRAASRGGSRPCSRKTRVLVMTNFAEDRPQRLEWFWRSPMARCSAAQRQGVGSRLVFGAVGSSYDHHGRDSWVFLRC